MVWETDRRRLEQRQKQIDFGLATTGYANYVAWLKDNKGRVKPIPIPNIYLSCSKRSWDGQIRHWRRLLHLWDSTEKPTGTLADQQFQDPCAQENVNYADEEFPGGILSPPSNQGVSSQPPQQGTNPQLQNWQLNRFGGDAAGAYPYARSYHPQYTPQAFHMNNPATQYMPPYQFLPMHQPGYTYPAGPPEWPVPTVSRGCYTVHMPGPQFGDAIGAEFVFVADQETAGRFKIAENEASELQETVFQRYCEALVAASMAHRQLALRSHVAESTKAWSEADISLLLGKEFAHKERCEVQHPTDELLPPSLSEAIPRNPTSPTACSDSGRSRASFDLHLDEERYSNFRRRFGDPSSSSNARSPLESPPPCWSPARITPSTQPHRGMLSASPGLTPSPADWFGDKRSPLPVSPRAALAFADWASPQIGTSKETAKASKTAEEVAPGLWHSSSP